MYDPSYPARNNTWIAQGYQYPYQRERRGLYRGLRYGRDCVEYVSRSVEVLESGSLEGGELRSLFVFRLIWFVRAQSASTGWFVYAPHARRNVHCLLLP